VSSCLSEPPAVRPISDMGRSDWKERGKHLSDTEFDSLFSSGIGFVGSHKFTHPAVISIFELHTKLKTNHCVVHQHVTKCNKIILKLPVVFMISTFQFILSGPIWHHAF
jgi:hypothetical protein